MTASPPRALRVAVVGHGKMGREVLPVLADRGHEAVLVAKGGPFPGTCSVAIDFSRAEAVLENVRSAVSSGARVVLGTTGWTSSLGEVRRLVEEGNGGLVFASNFSLGVNLFYRIVETAAGILAAFPDYDPYVLERHHRMKADAPSGTAKTLADILEKALPLRRDEHLTSALAPGTFQVSSLRAGGIVGDHTVGFDSGGDEILLEHRARSRRGYALGAVLAAEWISTRTGFYSFEEVVGDLMRQNAAPSA